MAKDPEWANDPEWSGTGVESHGRGPRGLLHVENSPINGREHLFEAAKRGIESEPERFGLKGLRKVGEAEYLKADVRFDDVAAGVDYLVDDGTVYLVRIEIKSGGTVREDRGQQRLRSELEHATLPGAEEAKGGDPSLAGLTPEQQQKWLEEAYRRFAVTYRDRAKPLADHVMQIAEAEGGPRQEPTLGLCEAARRISAARGKKLSDVQLLRYYREGLIGVEGPDKSPRFSEYQCEHFIPPGRPRGRPKKNPTARTSEKTPEENPKSPP